MTVASRPRAAMGPMPANVWRGTSSSATRAASGRPCMPSSSRSCASPWTTRSLSSGYVPSQPCLRSFTKAICALTIPVRAASHAVGLHFYATSALKRGRDGVCCAEQ